MEAGRELDALIAERVMGWTDVRHDWPCEYVVDGWMVAIDEAEQERLELDGRDVVGYEPPREGSRPLLDRVPAYSTDIATAWQVVAKMREHASPRFQSLALVVWCYNRTYATFDANAFTEYDPTTWVEANGEHTTPLAICRAALAAGEGRHE